MTLDEINRLLAEIATAADESEIAVLTLRNADAIAGLPELEREQVNEQIADASRQGQAPHHVASQPTKARKPSTHIVGRQQHTGLAPRPVRTAHAWPNIFHCARLRRLT